MRLSFALRCGLFVSGAGFSALAAPAGPETPPSAYQDLRWRLLGPHRGGWATCVAGVPGDPRTFYFGGADGGVFKSEDAGQTWRPIFDRYGSASIGALAVAPSDPRVIWIGTGQVQQRWDITAGDGVYVSRDAGASWTHAGLRETRHIGRIWVDPRNAEVAVVAALGHVFGPNDERGLFRTEDGGRSWKKVLFRDQDTGAVEIAGDPAHPDTLYAALWQLRRYPWLDYFQPPVGPGSALYKSTDGGRSWRATGTTGFAPDPRGRIALAVAPGTSALRVYASVHASKGGGLYRTDDGGTSWTEVSADASLASAYMNMVAVDPRSPDTLFVMGRSIRRSTDGGRTFDIVKGAPGGDDYHFLWIDPREPERMITGADQGAVVTLNGGRSWSSWYNQPTGQFYRLAADDRFPYRVYSGQQDSGTVSLPIRSDYGQLTFRDWHPVGGDERDGDVPDPRDPDVVYGAGLGGRLSRWDAKTGQVQNVAPWPVSSYGQRPRPGAYRYSWITPLAISPRPPHAIYLGAQVLFRSTDGGLSWQTISPDLSGAASTPRPCPGEVRVEDATACGFGVIFAITPSPVADGLVWAGTDNGRVHLTRDDGKTWTDVTPAGLGDWTKVNLIDASASDPATAYLAVDRHRLDDFSPRAYRTHDYGASWTEIGHGLPAVGFVGVVRADPVRRGLLYAGTSRGVHVSFDDGDHWQSLQLDLPTTGINDLIVKGNDLVVATQGRALWALDDVTPLRSFYTGPLDQPLLAPPARAFRLAASQNKDTPLPADEPRAANPPAGAVIDYFLPTAPSSPLTLEVLGPDGTLVRRFRSDDPPPSTAPGIYFADLWRGPVAPLTARPGHNRFVWNLRYPQPRAFELDFSIAAVPGQPTPTTPQGPFVLPGTYKVRLVVDGRTLEQPLPVSLDPRRLVSAEDLAASLEFQREVIAGLESASGAATTTQGLRDRLAALATDPRAKAAASLVARAQRAMDPLAADDGPEALAGVLAALETDLEAADARPTAPQRQLLAQSRERLERAVAQLDAVRKGPIADLQRRLRPLGLKVQGAS